MKKSERIANIILIVSSLIYFCFMMKILLFKYYSFTEVIQSDYVARRNFNLIPFHEIGLYLWGRAGEKLVIANILGNIVLFVPAGLIMRAMKNRKSALSAILWVFIFSISIEVVQYVLGIGTMDVDDIILNTLGGGVGVLFYWGLLLILKEHRKVKLFISYSAGVCGVILGVYLAIMLGSESEIKEYKNITNGREIERSENTDIGRFETIFIDGEL